MPQLRSSRGTRTTPRRRGSSRSPLSGLLQVLGWLPRTIAHALGSLLSRIPKRVLVGGIAGIIAALALVFGVSSLMRACSRTQVEDVVVSPHALTDTLAERAGTGTAPALEQASVSSLQTAAWATLNQDRLISWIAARASAYDSYAGLDAYGSYHALALSTRSPLTAHFVYSLGRSVCGDTGGTATAVAAGNDAASGASTTSSAAASNTAAYSTAANPAADPSTGCTSTALPYTGAVTKDTAPILYQWDERWGSYAYCSHPLAFTGCGVTVASMAYMGLTGKADLTPAEMATLAEQAGEADMGTNATFFTNAEVETATGVSGAKIYDTAEALTAALKDGKLVAISVRPGTLANGSHWALAVGVEADGSIRINDPNSPTNTAKSWDAEELAGYAYSMYALGLAS